VQRSPRPFSLLAAAALSAVLLNAHAQQVAILAAESGLFSEPSSQILSFVPSSRLPLRDGQSFGWRIKVQTTKKRVLVQEEVILPSEPKTWGDPEPDLKRRTSPDGRMATSQYELEPQAGYIFNSWVVTTGDPRGTWIIRVTVEGNPPQTFRFQAQ
jgi:hypothetical protein